MTMMKGRRKTTRTTQTKTTKNKTTKTNKKCLSYIGVLQTRNMMIITKNMTANQIPTTTRTKTITTTKATTKKTKKGLVLPWSIANKKHDDDDEQHDCSSGFFLFVFCVCIVGAS